MSRIYACLSGLAILVLAQPGFASYIENSTPATNNLYVGGAPNPSSSFIGSSYDFSGTSGKYTLIAPHVYITVAHVPPANGTITFTNSSGKSVTAHVLTDSNGAVGEMLPLGTPLGASTQPDIYIGLLKSTENLSDFGIKPFRIIDAHVTGFSIAADGTMTQTNTIHTSPLQGQPFFVTGNNTKTSVEQLGINQIDMKSTDAAGNTQNGVRFISVGQVGGNKSESLDFTYTFNPGSTPYQTYLTSNDSGMPDFMPTSPTEVGLLGLNEGTTISGTPQYGDYSASILLSPYYKMLQHEITKLETNNAFSTIDTLPSMVEAMPGLIPVPEPSSFVLLGFMSLLWIARSARPILRKPNS